MSLEVPHLRYIVAAADHSSFRRAAAALNITQPTLSKRIHQLEVRLGVDLFERSSGGAKLTPIGEDIVTAARRVLTELDGMKSRAIAAKSGDAGRLKIGFYTSISAGALRDTIFSFSSQHPDVEVDLVEGARTTLLASLDRSLVDIVFMLGDARDHPHYEHKSLWSERIMAVLPNDHSFAARDFIYWTDLKSERFLLSCRDPGPEIQDILTRKLASPGDRPNIKTIDVKREDVLSMVGGNRGISLACESATGNVIGGVTFCEVRDGNGPTRVGYVGCWRRINDNPALKQFLILLHAHPAVPPGGNGGAAAG